MLSSRSNCQHTVVTKSRLWHLGDGQLLATSEPAQNLTVADVTTSQAWNQYQQLGASDSTDGSMLGYTQTQSMSCPCLMYHTSYL